MARTEKKTRIKGLPPKVFIGEMEAATGSYPYVSHNGVVDQNLRWLPFSDQNVLNFTQSNIYFGLGVPTASLYIPRLTYLTTSLTMTGSAAVRAGIVDTFFENQRYNIVSQAFVPYKDNDQFQADGKSTGGSFWLTGTNIEGLTAPVWSKTKLEIPITVTTNSTFKIRRDVNNDSYQMGYFNFSSKTWEGAGLGFDLKMFNDQATTPGLSAMLTHSLCGFATAMMTPRDSAWHIRALGEQVESFGFPFASKYHATSSQLFPMRNLINKPFLVEKFVVMVSASFSGSISSYSESMTRPFETNTNLFPIASNTFFIMNQKTKQNFVKPFTGITSTLGIYSTCPTSSQISKNGSVVFVDTIRDVLGYANIVSYGSNLGSVYSASVNTTNSPISDSDESFENRSIFDDLSLKEHLISTGISGAAGTFWGPQKLVFSGTMAMPYESLGLMSSFVFYFPLPASSKTVTLRTMLNTAQNAFFANSATSSTDYRGGGRNGFGGDYYDGRSLLVSVPSSEIIGKREPVSSLRRFQQYKKTNPYLLLPEDNLVVGWQLPLLYPSIVGSVSSSNTLTMTFHPGEAKIVLYGSFLSDNAEIEQTLSQNLTSETVHEAIE